MKYFTNGRVFLGALALGILYILIGAGHQKWSDASATEALRTRAGLKQLTASVSISEQLAPAQLKAVHKSGYTTIIDLRPDGEAVGQPTAAAMQAAAGVNELAFFYVPVPHGTIKDAAVDALDQALAQSKGPVLIYCRSGRRAARTWALVEASRTNGLTAAQIHAAVKAGGQSADDLASAIDTRVSLRAPLHADAP